MVPWCRQVHDPVDDQGCAFETVKHSRLEGPGWNKPPHVLGIDLLQRAVPVCIVRPAVHQPVVIVGAGFRQVVVIDGADWLGRRLPSQWSWLKCWNSPTFQHQPGDEPQSHDEKKTTRSQARKSVEGEVQCAHGGYLTSPPEAPAESRERTPESLDVTAAPPGALGNRISQERDTQAKLSRAIILGRFAESSTSRSSKSYSLQSTGCEAACSNAAMPSKRALRVEAASAGASIT